MGVGVGDGVRVIVGVGVGASVGFVNPGGSPIAVGVGDGVCASAESVKNVPITAKAMSA